MNEKPNERFVVSKENWSLHRKGDQDQQRHMEKVKDAIQSNLPDLISEESIIMSGGKETIKIPIRSLDEYKIRYNHDKTQHVGQGDGESQIGDVVGSDGSEAESGSGPQAGNLPGQDYYETEVSISEIETTLFEELGLPNLEQRDQAELTAEHVEFNDIRKIGLIGNIDKKQTLLSAFKRNAMEGKAEIMPISKEDLRFKTWDEVNKPESQAVVLAMMDTSGSMGTIQKYIARSFFFWMTKFLHTNYKTVEIEFIAHHTEAKVVSEQDFFSKGESGGTICSSAYEKALELIEEKYNPTRYNIYPFHFSDGENMSSDNKKCLELVEKLMEISNLFGYGEVNVFNRFSTLMSTYELIDNPKFKHYVLKGNEDVYHALKSFFPKNLEGAH